MKKGYLCSDKIQKRMKSKNIQRLTRFLDHRSSNWQQRLCLIIFLTLCLTVIVAGVPMHIMGIVGRSRGVCQNSHPLLKYHKARTFTSSGFAIP